MDLTLVGRGGGVPGRGAGVARDQPGRVARGVRRGAARRATPGRGSRSTCAWERRLFADRWAVVSWPAELRRAGRVAVGVAALRGGVLPGRRAAAGHAERHLPAGAHRVRVRHARAAGPHPPPHGRRRGPLVPGLVGAERRQRPGRRARARRGGSTAAGCSTARRRGRPAARSARTCSGSSAPTRSSERHKGLTYLLVPLDTPGRHRARLRPPRRRRGLRRGVLRGRLPRRRRACPAAWCSASSTGAGRSRWPPPAPSAGSRCARPGRFLATAERLLDAVPREGRRRRTCASASSTRGCAPRRTSCSRSRPSPGWPSGAKPGAEAVDHQDLVERARRRAARDRPRPARPRRRARGAVGEGLPVRAVRPDLRRHQRDPAQHRRRARAGAPPPMRFALTDDQVAFRDAVRELLAKEATPAVVRAAWDAPTASSTAACGTASTRWACCRCSCPRPTAGSASTRLTSCRSSRRRAASRSRTRSSRRRWWRRRCSARGHGMVATDLGGPLVPCAADADRAAAALRRGPRARRAAARSTSTPVDDRRSGPARRASPTHARRRPRHRRPRRSSSWRSTAAPSARPRSSSGSARRCSTSPSTT